MLLGTVSNFLKSSAYGFMFYQSYRYSRALAVGWDEQRGLCTVDFIGSMAMFVLTSKDNLKFLGGDKLISRMNRCYYFSYIGIPALHYATKKLKDSEHIHVRDAVNFTYLHLSDAIIVASVVQAVAAIYYGFNRAGNLLQLASITWAVAEQGVFWMKPEEDSGPIAKVREGSLLRSYEPIVSSLHLTLGIPFYFLYRGIFGKINALVSAILRFFPEQLFWLIKKMTPQSAEDFFDEALKGMEEEIGFRVVATPERVEKKWIVDEEDKLKALTEKHFELFKIEDHFPDQTLAKLETDLQHLLQEDTDSDLEEIGYTGTVTLTKREILQELLGSLDHPGYLRRHVISCRTEEEMREKEIKLKNIFGVLTQDWDGRKSRLVMNYENFLCHMATGSTITDLCLEFYNEVSQAKGDQREVASQILEKRISLILQQRRDRNFFAVVQGFIMMMHQQKEFLKEYWDKEEEKLYAEIESWDVSSLDWWKGFGSYSWTYLKNRGFDLFNDVTLTISSARHQVNMNTVMFGRSLNLSFAAEARRDIKMQLAKNLVDISIIDRIGESYQPLMRPMVQKVYVDGMNIDGEIDDRGTWRDELITAIVSYQDTRLDFELVRDYVRDRAQVFGLDVDDEALQVESLKPTVNPQESFDQWVDENQSYERAKKGFLEKYLPQVLYDLGYVTYQEGE